MQKDLTSLKQSDYQHHSNKVITTKTNYFAFPVYIVMILSFRSDRSWQTVQTQIRLLLEEQSDQGLHCLLFPLHLFNEFSIKVWLLCLNFGVFWCPKIKELYGTQKYPGNMYILSFSGLWRAWVTLGTSWGRVGENYCYTGETDRADCWSCS